MSKQQDKNDSNNYTNYVNNNKNPNRNILKFHNKAFTGLMGHYHNNTNKIIKEMNRREKTLNTQSAENQHYLSFINNNLQETYNPSISDSKNININDTSESLININMKEKIKNKNALLSKNLGLLPDESTHKTSSKNKSNDCISHNSNNYNGNNLLSELNENAFKLKDNSFNSNNDSKLNSNIENTSVIWPNEKYLKQGAETKEAKETRDYTKFEVREFLRIKPVYDSFSEDEENFIGKSNELFIHPNSHLKFFFDFLNFFAAIYCITFLPLRMIFWGYSSMNFFIIEAVVSLVFFADLMAGFFTAYYDFEENLITAVNKIVHHYLSSFFFWDLLTAIPFSFYIEYISYTACNPVLPYCTSYKVYSSLFKHATRNSVNQNTFYVITSGNSGSSSMTSEHNTIDLLFNIKSIHSLLIVDNLNKAYVLFKIIRVLKIIKIFNLNEFLNRTKGFFNTDSFSINFSFKIIFFYIMFIIISHILTCIFILLGTISYPNWIVYSHLENATFLELYLNSLYFNHLTIFTVGYGDIVSKNIYERCYNICLMIVGIMLYSFALTSISNIIKMDDMKRKIYDNKKEFLDNISEKYFIKKKLYDKLSRHLFHEMKTYTSKILDFLNELPITLRNEMILNMHRKIIKSFNFFKHVYDNDFIIQVIITLKPTSTVRNDILLKQGDFIEEIILIKIGILQLEVVIDDFVNNDKFSQLPRKQLCASQPKAKNFIYDSSTGNDRKFANLGNSNILGQNERKSTALISNPIKEAWNDRCVRVSTHNNYNNINTNNDVHNNSNIASNNNTDTSLLGIQHQKGLNNHNFIVVDGINSKKSITKELVSNYTSIPNEINKDWVTNMKPCLNPSYKTKKKNNDNRNYSNDINIKNHNNNNIYTNINQSNNSSINITCINTNNNIDTLNRLKSHKSNTYNNRNKNKRRSSTNNNYYNSNYIRSSTNSTAQILISKKKKKCKNEHILNNKENHINNNMNNSASNSFSNPNQKKTSSSKKVKSFNSFSKKAHQKNDDIEKIKILQLYKNEDFGLSLLIDNSRSPLTVRTKSRRAEIFLINKIDVIKLYETYSLLFEKIYKKSTFNLNQIMQRIEKLKGLKKTYCAGKEITSNLDCLFVSTNFPAKNLEFDSLQINELLTTNSQKQKNYLNQNIKGTTILDANIKKSLSNNNNSFKKMTPLIGNNNAQSHPIDMNKESPISVGTSTIPFEKQYKTQNNFSPKSNIFNEIKSNKQNVDFIKSLKLKYEQKENINYKFKLNNIEDNFKNLKNPHLKSAEMAVLKKMPYSLDKYNSLKNTNQKRNSMNNENSRLLRKGLFSTAIKSKMQISQLLNNYSKMNYEEIPKPNPSIMSKNFESLVEEKPFLNTINNNKIKINDEKRIDSPFSSVSLHKPLNKGQKNIYDRNGVNCGSFIIPEEKNFEEVCEIKSNHITHIYPQSYYYVNNNKPHSHSLMQKYLSENKQIQKNRVDSINLDYNSDQNYNSSSCFSNDDSDDNKSKIHSNNIKNNIHYHHNRNIITTNKNTNNRNFQNNSNFNLSFKEKTLLLKSSRSQQVNSGCISDTIKSNMNKKDSIMRKKYKSQTFNYNYINSINHKKNHFISSNKSINIIVKIENQNINNIKNKIFNINDDSLHPVFLKNSEFSTNNKCKYIAENINLNESKGNTISSIFHDKPDLSNIINCESISLNNLNFHENKNFESIFNEAATNNNNNNFKKLKTKNSLNERTFKNKKINFTYNSQLNKNNAHTRDGSIKKLDDLSSSTIGKSFISHLRDRENSSNTYNFSRNIEEDYNPYNNNTIIKRNKNKSCDIPSLHELKTGKKYSAIGKFQDRSQEKDSEEELNVCYLCKKKIQEKVEKIKKKFYNNYKISESPEYYITRETSLTIVASTTDDSDRQNFQNLNQAKFKFNKNYFRNTRKKSSDTKSSNSIITAALLAKEKPTKFNCKKKNKTSNKNNYYDMYEKSNYISSNRNYFGNNFPESNYAKLEVFEDKNIKINPHEFLQLSRSNYSMNSTPRLSLLLNTREGRKAANTNIFKLIPQSTEDFFEKKPSELNNSKKNQAAKSGKENSRLINDNKLKSSKMLTTLLSSNQSYDKNKDNSSNQFFTNLFGESKKIKKFDYSNIYNDNNLDNENNYNTTSNNNKLKFALNMPDRTNILLNGNILNDKDNFLKTQENSMKKGLLSLTRKLTLKNINKSFLPENINNKTPIKYSSKNIHMPSIPNLKIKEKSINQKDTRYSNPSNYNSKINKNYNCFNRSLLNKGKFISLKNLKYDFNLDKVKFHPQNQHFRNISENNNINTNKYSATIKSNSITNFNNKYKNHISSNAKSSNSNQNSNCMTQLNQKLEKIIGILNI